MQKEPNSIKSHMIKYVVLLLTWPARYVVLLLTFTTPAEIIQSEILK